MTDSALRKTQQIELGDRRSSEMLINDLYVSLRHNLLQWAAITHQTPQARMGYIGQHLVSVVTGFPGGKSGARGFDLILPGGGEGEIKTCSRVDQLGQCQQCGATVSAIEKKCSDCNSTDIQRKDDSKWLIGVKTETDFKQVLDPVFYYLVLFELEDISTASNNNIVASIWKIDPRVPGFVYCMIDYKLNIQSKSRSKAPFNLWPWSTKFFAMRPELIYRSHIQNDFVSTKIFPDDPTVESPRTEPFPDLYTLKNSRAITVEALKAVLKGQGIAFKNNEKKNNLIKKVQDNRSKLSDEDLADIFAEAIYWPLIEEHMESIYNDYPQIAAKMPSVLWLG